MTDYGKHIVEKAMESEQGSIGLQEAQNEIKRMYAKLTVTNALTVSGVAFQSADSALTLP